MAKQPLIDVATEALDECDAALLELDQTCCVPERSPRMQEIGDSLVAIRSGLEASLDSDLIASSVIGAVEEVGAKVGHLQVTCCAPNRAPLYATILSGLMDVQRSISRGRLG